MVPFHVNCYGSSVIAKRGSSAHLTGAADPDAVDPPGPNPGRCFDVGAAVARALADSPWRVALVASSSWSHAFLTKKHHWLYPDVASDRARFDELASGNFARWRNLTTAQIEDAGQQEFLNWVCLAGAMDALDRTPEIVDYVGVLPLQFGQVLSPCFTPERIRRSRGKPNTGAGSVTRPTAQPHSCTAGGTQPAGSVGEGH